MINHNIYGIKVAIKNVLDSEDEITDADQPPSQVEDFRLTTYKTV